MKTNHFLNEIAIANRCTALNATPEQKERYINYLNANLLGLKNDSELFTNEFAIIEINYAIDFLTKEIDFLK